MSGKDAVVFALKRDNFVAKLRSALICNIDMPYFTVDKAAIIKH